MNIYFINLSLNTFDIKSRKIYKCSYIIYIYFD
jgi:hypothetical protein